MAVTVYSLLFKSFLESMKVFTPAIYAHESEVPLSIVEDWLSGERLMSYENVRDLEIRIKVAYARACNFNCAAFKADFERRLETAEFYDRLEAAYEDLKNRGIMLEC